MSKAAELAKIGEVATNSQIGGRRNIIINGAMQVAQRGTSSTGLGAATGYFTLDRWSMVMNATSAGRYTMTQSAVTDLAGFSNALKIECTTADTSIAAGEALLIEQIIEGLNLQQIKASSTSTKAFTVSYYAKSNASRAVVLEILMAEGTNKQISALHTIGTSWARYSMTVPAASSTELDNDNTEAMQVNLWLHGGSTFAGGTLNTGALAASTNANRAAGIGSIFASTDNTLEITGFQIEVGSQATPFEHRSFGEELQLCKRYFQGTIGAGFFGVGRTANSSTMFQVPLQTPMRATPTASLSTTTVTIAEPNQANFNITSATISGAHVNNRGGAYYLNGTVTVAVGDNLFLSTDYLKFDAEL